MSISDLLMSQKRWGRTRCRRLLMSLGVPENKQVGTLTDRQRIALAAVLTQKNAPAGDDDASATGMERERADGCLTGADCGGRARPAAARPRA